MAEEKINERLSDEDSERILFIQDKKEILIRADPTLCDPIENLLKEMSIYIDYLRKAIGSSMLCPTKKADPYIVGGAMSALFGGAVGVSAAYEVAKENQHIEEEQKKYLASQRAEKEANKLVATQAEKVHQLLKSLEEKILKHPETKKIWNEGGKSVQEKVTAKQQKERQKEQEEKFKKTGCLIYIILCFLCIMFSCANS